MGRGTGLVLALAAAAGVLWWTRRASGATVTPSFGPDMSVDEMLARVQQERIDELEQWRIVERNAWSIVNSLSQKTALDPLDQMAFVEWSTTLNNARVKIDQLEREIAAH